MLPVDWATHSLMPYHGIFKFTYYSGGGTGADNCKPLVEIRMALLLLGLLKEQYLIPDHIRFATDNASSAAATTVNINNTCRNIGVTYAEQHAELFTQYLLNTEVIMSNKIDVVQEAKAEEAVTKKKAKGKPTKKK